MSQKNEDKKEYKEPYSLSASVQKGESSTVVYVTISTKDAQRYPLPTSIKKLEAKIYGPKKNKLIDKYKATNVPLTDGQTSFSVTGVLNFQKMLVSAHIKPSGWHDENLDCEALVLLQPDLSIKTIIGPNEIIVGAPFTVEAVVQETNLQVGATATVTLSEGTTILGTVPNVVVAKGGTVSVVFEGIKATTLGTHTYTVTISSSSPVESNTANNSASFTTTAIQPTPTNYTLSYGYNKTITTITFTSNWGYNSYYTDTVEASTLDYATYLSTTTLPVAPLDRVNWKIETPALVFDQSSFTNLVPTSSDENSDAYTLRNVGNKNIDFTLTVDRQNGSLVASLTQYYSWDVYIFRDNDVTIQSRVVLGDTLAPILPPDVSLSVTFTLVDNGNAWGGKATIQVPPVVESGSSSTETNGDPDDEDKPYSERLTVNGVFETFASATGTTTPAVSIQIPIEVAEDIKTSSPMTFDLGQNYPNPFNPSTSIQFSLPRASFVTLKVYDVLAREIGTLAEREFTSGFHTIRWDASGVPSGTYIYRLQAGEYSAQRKLILLK